MKQNRAEASPMERTNQPHSSGLELRVVKCPRKGYEKYNRVYMHPADAEALSLPSGRNYVLVNNFVYNFAPVDSLPQGVIGLTDLQRLTLYVSLNEKIRCVPFQPAPGDKLFLASMQVECDLFFTGGRGTGQIFGADSIEQALKASFQSQFFSRGQMFAADVTGILLRFKVLKIELAFLSAPSQEADTSSSGKDKKSKDKQVVQAASDLPSSSATARGMLIDTTEIVVVPASGASIKVTTGTGTAHKKLPDLFKADWSFQQMGIGALDKEFSEIFRRAFAPRFFPTSLTRDDLGLVPVKGILLYGPPGNGKTLMAKKIGQMLNCKEPIIVNGPDVLNKYVGESEANIRKIFAPAFADYKQFGDESELHLIIIDEMDAICAKRGLRTGSGVSDTIVNQLLTMLDGVGEINNILVIGMTNRLDIIDEALLRPGRLEVHMEIGLPDEAGRLQILNIHTEKMRRSSRMAPDVDLPTLAKQTRNFSGAELAGLVRNAAAFACSRQLDMRNPMDRKAIENANVIVTLSDFERALQQTVPAFGIDQDEIKNTMRNGIIHYSPGFTNLMDEARLFVQQVVSSKHSNMATVLFMGEAGCGKSAFATAVATDSGFPFVKVISPRSMVAMSETVRCQLINKCFEDAYRSALSVIVIDDIERLLDYSAARQQYSNNVLQTLLVLLKKEPPSKDKKLLVLGTSSKPEVMEALEVKEAFDAALSIPCLSSGQDVARILSKMDGYSEAEVTEISKKFNGAIPIKKLYQVAERALQTYQGNTASLVDRFFKCLNDYGYGK
jgi:vesicle-fusing ATPase